MNVFDHESAVTGENVPHLTFAQEPTYVANGTNSDEFTLDHLASTGEDDFGYVNMTWTHSPGSMSWKEPYDPYGDLPESNDF